MLKPIALLGLLCVTLGTAPLAPATRPDERERLRQLPVEPGDKLVVYIFELELPGLWYAKVVEVDKDGIIEIAVVGRVTVSNLVVPAIEAKIGTALLDRMLLSLPKGSPGPEVNVVLIPAPGRARAARPASAPQSLPAVR